MIRCKTQQILFRIQCDEIKDDDFQQKLMQFISSELFAWFKNVIFPFEIK